VLAQFAKRLRYPHGRSAGGCADRAAQGALFASKGGGGTVKPLWMAGMITAAITDALARTARMRFPDLLAVRQRGRLTSKRMLRVDPWEKAADGERALRFTFHP